MSLARARSLSRLASSLLLRPSPSPLAVGVAASPPAVCQRRHAGHSRWQNVKADKEAGAAQKAAAIQNFGRLVRKAVQDGNGVTDPQSNQQLKLVLDRAKASNVPMKSLERAIASASQEVQPYVVEVRGKGGLCVLVQSNAAAKTKCKQQVASMVKRVGLEVAGVDSSITTTFFEKKGFVEVVAEEAGPASLDAALEAAVELECADVRPGDGERQFVFECDPALTQSVASELQSRGCTVLEADWRYEPIEHVEIDSATDRLLQDLYAKIKDGVEGVVNVYDNVTVAA